LQPEASKAPFTPPPPRHPGRVAEPATGLSLQLPRRAGSKALREQRVWRMDMPGYNARFSMFFA